METRSIEMSSLSTTGLKKAGGRMGNIHCHGYSVDTDKTSISEQVTSTRVLYPKREPISIMHDSKGNVRHKAHVLKEGKQAGF